MGLHCQDERIYDKSSPKMTPENIQQGHLWKDFANSLTEPTNSICGLALNGIQYILLGINAWCEQFDFELGSTSSDVFRTIARFTWGDYTAISYMWGSPEDTKTITINGMPVTHC